MYAIYNNLCRKICVKLTLYTSIILFFVGYVYLHKFTRYTLASDFIKKLWKLEYECCISDVMSGVSVEINRTVFRQTTLSQSVIACYCLLKLFSALFS